MEPGPGRANHNAPWSWSVREQGSLLVNGLCLGCAFAWDTPSKAEVGITNGPPYNCNDTHAGATWGMIMMQVTLIGLTDSR